MRRDVSQHFNIQVTLTVVKRHMVYHGGVCEDVSSSSVHRRAPAGMSVTEAVASDHHVVKSVVIFVLRVSASSTQQSVAQREETSEVNPDICHRD